MTLTLFFLRHGETVASQFGTYCGRLDIELTGSGLQMAEDFAQSYRSFNWVAVYSSPLQRAMATAHPLCQALGITIHQRPGLQEIFYGQWEGKTPTEVRRDFHTDYVKWLADPGWNSPTGGEKGIDIARRSSEVLEEIEQTHSHGNVLIVSHKATIRIMVCTLLGIDIGRFRDRLNVPVAALSVVEMGERGPCLHRIGDRSHLRPELQAREGN
ncbi:MAG: histidine phosphatase family protein [Cyanobacteria bacterium WB6_1B_304]|jgi:broad specificity phosphatase PhoE|nr:phosphoglycerate mutase family protein [Cyanobacteria bacterium REEB444]NBO31460.1 histidine phosphatase family protein [Cyanobacteria bacterium WB6_1B_304]